MSYGRVKSFTSLHHGLLCEGMGFIIVVSCTDTKFIYLFISNEKFRVYLPLDIQMLFDAEMTCLFAVSRCPAATQHFQCCLCLDPEAVVVYGPQCCVNFSYRSPFYASSYLEINCMFAVTAGQHFQNTPCPAVS